MMPIFYFHSQLVSVVAASALGVLVGTFVMWPSVLHILFRTVQVALAGVLSILLLNIVVLLVYVKYIVFPSSRQQTFNFPPLRFAHRSTWSELQQQRLRENTSTKRRIGSSEEISEAFEELLSYVLRDFIDYWFVHVAGPGEVSFRESVDNVIRSAVLKVKQRLADTDLFGVLVNRLVPVVTSHISEFRSAEISLRGKSLERSVTQSDELDLLLASQFRAGRLHPALTTAAVTTKPTEVAYLRQVIDKVLPYVIDERELASPPVRVLVRELVSCAVLQPVMDMVADPDFWNQTIDAYLGKAIREQKMVQQLREVLNRHSNELEDITEPLSAVPNGLSKSKDRRPGLVAMNSLSSIFGDQWKDDPDNAFGGGRGSGFVRLGRRTFQEFLRMIEEEKNLLELKRVRNDIVTQVRKKRVQIHDRDPEEIVDGEKVADIIVYLNRLSVAKKRVDKRIAILTGEYDSKKMTRTHLFSPRRRPTEALLIQPVGCSLHEILTNTAGLSYFMEFMDRRGETMKLQFWLLVEGFKTSEGSSNIGEQQKRRTAAMFLQDVQMVHSMYLSDSAPHRLKITGQLKTDLQEKLGNAQRLATGEEEGHEAFLDAVQALRRSLYEIHDYIYTLLEKEHFPYFKHSDLYFKYLATTPNENSTTSPERRSLDENALYRSSRNRDSSSSTNEGPLTARPLERTASARVSKKKSWLEGEEQPVKADSDTELNNEARLIKQGRASSGGGKSEEGRVDNEMESSLLQQQQQQQRRRGHVRAFSENTNLGFASRFLSFGRMVESANEWWDWQGYAKRKRDEDSKRNSIHESIKSIDTEDLMEGEEEEDDGILSRSAATTIDEPEEASVSRPSKQLVRSNTVEAVEAELQSIIDGNDNQLVEERKDKERRKSVSSSTTSSPSKRYLQAPLLLGATKGIKSSMALPVQNDYKIPTWRSAGGSNVLNELEHDKVDDEPLSPRKSSHGDNHLLVDPSSSDDANIHLAPPGDLMLAAKVKKISEEMEKLMQQERIVDALIEKAEAKNKVEELRILKKSKNMFRREMQQMKYQKSQYELQESENVLTPNRTKISITSSTIGSDSSGEFALYIIEIQQLGLDGNYASGWIVARRYNEFFALHQTLKDQYQIVKHLDFPSKWPLLRLQKAFVEARRTNLERYLRRLLEDPEICKSQELRAFLSQQSVYVPGPRQQEDDTTTCEYGFFTSVPRLTKQPPAATMEESTKRLRQQLQSSPSSSTLNSSKSQRSLLQKSSLHNNNDGGTAIISSTGSSPNIIQRKPSAGFMKHIYKTVAEGIDDLSIGPSMLDIITQRMGEQVMDFFYDENNNGPTTAGDASQEESVAVNGTSEFPESFKTAAAAAAAATEGITKFTEPLCDLFIEMFELKEKNNWLRRQAVVIILQQILGGTIERKLRDTVRFLQSEPMVVFYLKKVTDSLWPGGQSIQFKPPRGPDEKQQTKEAANRKLSTWLPDLLGQMVGRQNARRGARRLFTVLQNKRLNQDLVYTLFDEIVVALFPEVDKQMNNTL